MSISFFRDIFLNKLWIFFTNVYGCTFLSLRIGIEHVEKAYSVEISCRQGTTFP